MGEAVPAGGAQGRDLWSAVPLPLPRRPLPTAGGAGDPVHPRAHRPVRARPPGRAGPPEPPELRAVRRGDPPEDRHRDGAVRRRTLPRDPAEPLHRAVAGRADRRHHRRGQPSHAREAGPHDQRVRGQDDLPGTKARAQRFPDQHRFGGSRAADLTRQVGNAVPVNVARWLGERIAPVLV
ncbi:DNA cytosine methyltransferase [Streptomyces parvus]|uniref:DNA cytosine methyltransferase n=1 Tax=Streptomyces parvus TaxID=66428 RepID=UPI0037249906